MKVMNKLYLVMLVMPLVLSGCVNVKEVRDDGVYKQYDKTGYVYYSFSKEPKELYMFSCKSCSDAEALKMLAKQRKNPDKNRIGYFNKDRYISIYGDNGNLHWDGRIWKNKNGDIDNSVFLQEKDGKIIETEDYRNRQ